MARLPVDGRVPKGTVTGNCEDEDGKLESCGHITNDDKIDRSLNWFFSDKKKKGYKFISLENRKRTQKPTV